MNHYDFHSHTHYSDGVLSPEELLDRAEEKGLQLLAVSDHDSISGLAQAQAHIYSNKLKVKVVNAIELTTQSDFGEIHLVGLNINPSDINLIRLIEKQQRKRWQRAEIYDEKFQRLHITGMMDELKKRCKQVVTRSHLAAALVYLGKVKDFNQAFKKYLGKTGCVKVATDWVSMEDAIATIKQAGGVSVLAHPTRYPMSNRRLSYLVEAFKTSQGDAIEVAYPSISVNKKQWIEALCQKNQLYASAGSDFHYPDLKWSDLGRFPMVDKNIPHVLDLIKM